MSRLVRFYWFIPIVLALIQFLFILNSFNQIRLEELAESARSEFWFSQHLIFSNYSFSNHFEVAPNLGWYLVLSAIYKFFGFWIFTAKIYKLLIWLFALFALADLLKRYLGIKLAAIPLITIGLSPTILYFNTLAINSGIEVSFFLIILWLLIVTPGGFNRKTALLYMLVGFLLILALLSYAAFTPFFLTLTGMLLWKTRGSFKKIGASLLGFILPLIFFLSWIKNIYLLFPASLITNISKSSAIDLNLRLIINNLVAILSDLFSQSSSYYFEVKNTEFSSFFPIISVILLLILSGLIFFKLKSCRTYILFFSLLLILDLFLALLFNANLDLGGIRRGIGVLVAVYAFYVLAFKYLFGLKTRFKKLFLIILLLIPIHHLLVLPSNLSNISDLSGYRDKSFFYPPERFSVLEQDLQVSDLRLTCSDKTGKEIYCGYYNLTYGTLMVGCTFNKLSCKDIYGYDSKTNSFIKLSTEVFSENYFSRE